MEESKEEKKDDLEEAHEWPPPSIAQQKARNLYELRREISGNASSDSSRIKILSENILPGALLAKDLHNEENLLMHAASMGRGGWFKRIAKDIREQVGVHELVKGLRELDINGAPILSRAAASRENQNCFQEVYDELREVLGMGGVMGQLEAEDHVGRNIMMHAARSNHGAVFTKVRTLYKTRMMKPGRWGSENQMSSRYRTGSLEKQWKEKVTKEDRTGRTMLHHAAEAGCLEVLTRVIRMAKDEGVYDGMTSEDGNDRTPLMLILRNSWGSCGGVNNQDAKFKLLWENGGEGNWMKARDIKPIKVKTENNQENNHETLGVKAKTELFHAVRGGSSSLRLFLDHFPMPGATGGTTGIAVAEALGMERVGGAALNPADLEDIFFQRGNGMLLAAAAKGGHVDVMKKVVSAINDGRFDYRAQETETSCGVAMKEAIKSIEVDGSSLFTLAVMSGNPEAAGYAHDIIRANFDQAKETLIIVSGVSTETSLPTHTTPPLEAANNGGKQMFDKVYDCLEQAADAMQEPKDLIRDQFVPTRRGLSSFNQSPPSTTPKTTVTPLAAAALRGNWELFRHIYDKYERLYGRKWYRDEVVRQLPSLPPKAFRFERTKEMHETKHVDRGLSLSGDLENFSAVMWKDIVEAFQRATSREENNGDLPSWRGLFASYSEQAVETAIDERFFEDLRELVKEGFPLHDMVIPKLLENIEDHEQDIIDIVTYAVGNASNPFVMAASVSKNLRTAEIECPMHQNGLERLRLAVDGLTCKLLDKLPHTVRGMGMTLLRPILPEGRLPRTLQQTRYVLANLVGFIVVEWMLEPGLLLEKDAKKISARYIQEANGPAYVDPLRRAIDRGSQALEFLSKPLMLDYLHVKFMCTLPHFAAKTVVQSTINEGFYKYGEGKEYGLDKFWPTQRSPTDPNVGEPPNPESMCCIRFTWLLRFLQGCNQESGEESRGETDTPEGLDWSKFPHSTVLPGLQFLLAGVIGKPEIFYEVPAILFTFEFFSYLTMLGLFCWSVVLENRDYIPRKEKSLYVFVAGLVWREVLEFLDGMPLRRRGQRRGGYRALSGSNKKVSRQSITPGGKDMKRMVSACTRYILHDTWNFIDAMSIIFVVVAFFFRVRGTLDPGASASPSDDFFIAQFFLAASTPFFFARLLLLSQVDETLGPMIQILWRLVAHTARFAVFIVVVMASFGLAFHSLFFSCEEGTALYMHFGEFHRALLTVFAAALGEFGTIIDDFDLIGDQCGDLAPELAYHASVCLFVAYLVVMAVVLLNLLIAVLSTAHQEVYAKRRQQFFLARARLILQNAQAVAHRRIPVPFNLIQAIFGILFDFLAEILRQYYNIIRRFSGSVDSKQRFTPFTSKPAWFIIEGCLQRFAFAFTFGLFAVALSTFLWVVSLPWVAWSLVSWLFQRDSSKKGKKDSGKGSTRGCLNCIGESSRTGSALAQGLSQGGEKDEQFKGSNGHFRALLFILISGVFSVPALAFAALLGTLCSIGSVILWFRGLWSVCEWVSRQDWKASNSENEELTCPAPMPGQERAKHWGKAWHLAKARNCRIHDDKESVHFQIAPLLKSTTGLSMGDLMSLVEEHDEKRCTFKGQKGGQC